MSNVKTIDKLSLHLTTTLLVAGLVFPISPLLAASLKMLSSTGSSPCVEMRVEAGKEIVRAEDIIEALKKEGGEIDCSGRIIEGNLDLFKVPSEKGPQGKEEIIIKRTLKFRKAVFKGFITTWNQKKELKKQPPVKFLGKLDFIGARFEDHINFDGAIFQDNTNFGDAHFHRMASFTEATFKKFAGFRSTQFDGRALFKKTVFHGKADFGMATFNWLAFFLETEFLYPRSKYGANFHFTKFNGDTIFARAHFKSIARFNGTRFHGPTYFLKTIFEDQAWFISGDRFESNVTFKGVEFRKTGSIDRKKQGKAPRPPVLFCGVVFSGDTIFSNVKFGEVAFVEVGETTDIGLDTIFRKKVDFMGTTFEILDLRHVIFQSEVDFSGAEFGKVDFTDVDIGRASIRLKWNQLLERNGKPKFTWQGVLIGGTYKKEDNQASSAFFRFLSSLRRNFQEQGELEDAREVHYLVSNYKREEKRGLSKILDTIFLKWIYGYGVKPLHQVWTSFLIIVGWAFVYVRRNVLQYDQRRKRKKPLSNPLRITDIPIDWSGKKEVPLDSSTEVKQAKNFIYRYWQGFRFSFYVFTKMGYGGVYVRRKYRYVVIAEWFLALVLGILLVINLSNTWPLLYRIVTMLG